MENLTTVKTSLKIGVNSSGSKKVFLYIKASVNRQGLGSLIFFFFFLRFRLSEINLLPVKEQL